MIDSANPYAGLQLAARYRSLQRQLRRSALGMALFGIIAVTVGLVGLKIDPINGVLVALGAAMLAQTALSLLRPGPALLLSQGGLLIALGTWNSMISVLNSVNGPQVGPFSFIALFQLFWGIVTMRQFALYRGVPKTPPPPEMQQWLNQTAATLRKTRPVRDPSVIEFQTVQIGQRIRWKGRLAPDSLTLVDTMGVRMDILLPHEIDIKQGNPFFMLKNRFNIILHLRSKRLKGTMTRQSLQRFQAWQQQQQLVPGELWVPPA